MLGIILSTSYEKSQLEEFIETKYPDALGHKWIYLGTEYQYFLSGARGCSMQPVGVLPTAMSSGMLCDLSDANKKKLYEILVYASANLAQAEKSKRYSTLLDEPPSQVRDFIERFQVPPAKPEATESQTAVEK